MFKTLNDAIREITEIMKESSLNEWFQIYSFNSIILVKRALNYKLPISHCDWTKPDDYLCDMDGCINQHNWHITNRRCCELKNCPVNIRIYYCDKIGKYDMYQKGQHNHPLKATYNNIRGVDPFWN